MYQICQINDFVQCTLDKIDFFFQKILIRVFDRTKLHKEGSRNIFFYLRILSRFRGHFSSNALLHCNILH